MFSLTPKLAGILALLGILTGCGGQNEQVFEEAVGAGMLSLRAPVSTHAETLVSTPGTGAPMLQVAIDGRMTAINGWRIDGEGKVIVRRGGKEVEIDPQNTTASELEAMLFEVVHDPETAGEEEEQFGKLREWLQGTAAGMTKTPFTAASDLELASNPLMIRADDGTEFHFVQKILENCGRMDVLIWRTCFGVAAEPDGVGLPSRSSNAALHFVPAHLPVEEHPGEYFGPQNMPFGPVEKTELRIRVLAPGRRVNADGSGTPWQAEGDLSYCFDESRRLEYHVGPRKFVELSGARDRIGEIVKAGRTSAIIDAGRGTTYGEVIRAMDAMRDVGVESIIFEGPFR